MGESKKLTKTLIDNATYQGKGRSAYFIWDDEVPGFGVRIYPSGRKSFIISFRIKGKYKQFVIGQYGVYTLSQARKEARKHLGEVLSGIDPSQEKKRVNRNTIEALCLSYLERHSNVHNKPKTHKENERRILSQIIPKFGAMKITDLTRKDVRDFHYNLGKQHPYEANRVRALISSIFERAREWEIIPENHPNPAIGVKRFKEEKRDRWVKPDEMPNLLHAIKQENNIYIQSALLLYLLTGMRKNEVLNMKWNDIDWERQQVKLSDTKGGRVFYAQLSGNAIEILKNIPVQENNSFVICGRKQGSQLINIDIAWRRVRSRAGLDDVRLHDLRRTFGSWLALQGKSLLQIGKLLNHRNSATTEVYAHLMQDSLKDSVDEVGQSMIQLNEEENE